MTGLANRRRFDGALAREWRRAVRTRRAMCLLVIDIDHFKSFNDRYGHAIGDMILTGLGGAIAGCLHRAGGLACRIGGEEFAVILPDTDEAGAARICAAIHEAATRIRVPEADADPVTVSIGAFCCTDDATATGPDALFAAADAALYDAKRGGRNTTRWGRTDGTPASLPRVA